ncbi:MAG: hypothetical protein IJ594_03390 [Oscillospiraceae bacterium]|nr:hypothetical protein [Oscillospiraceae bacterium]
MNRRRECISILLALALLLALLLAAGWALVPELYISGTNWKRYRSEPAQSVDAIFVGSSMVFCDVAPGVIYENSGVTSYVVAGPEQSMAASYYYIRQALRTQSPKIVFLELGGMYFSLDEEHATANVAFLPRGRDRLEATFHAARREDIPGLLLPVLAYHERWYSVTLRELADKLGRGTDLYAGYTPHKASEPQEKTGVRSLGPEYADDALAWLGRIADFCRERDVQLVTYLAPAMRRLPEGSRRILERDVAAIPDVGYIDFNAQDELRTLGLDAQSDWFDSLHLNAAGARKFSVRLAQLLAQRGLPATEGEDAALWQARVEAVQTA